MGVPATEQYRIDEPYRNVVYSFHAYPPNTSAYTNLFEGHEPFYPYISPYTDNSHNAAAIEVARLQNVFNVPSGCTEMGVMITKPSESTEAEKYTHLQEIIELCYGQANFWQGFTSAFQATNPSMYKTAYPPKTVPSTGLPGAPLSAGRCFWTSFPDVPEPSGATVASYQDNWRFMDIIAYAAVRQASPAPAAAGSVTTPMQITVSASHTTMTAIPPPTPAR